jgi:nucleotide-binding universal stress UspA family protein
MMLNGSAIRTRWLRSEPATHPRRQRQGDVSGDLHVLVPISLSDDGAAALRLATQMAASGQGTLTLLYVCPPSDDRNPVHWLDAIDRLHEALDGAMGEAVAPSEGNPVLAARSAAWAIYLEAVPEALRLAVNIRVACRIGDFADQVARYADDSDADLVVIPCRPSRWWLPILPAQVRRVLQLTQKQVVLVRPDQRPHRPSVRC